MKYQKSISDELISAKDRVRSLIDNAHFGEDGRYKEILLREMIANQLPSFASVGTGFVRGDRLTHQIDIIVYDNRIPLIFRKSDFVIVPKEAVLGIVEVKTTWNRSRFKREYAQAHENGMIIGKYIFNGIFYYDCSNISRIQNSRDFFKGLFAQQHGYVNNISLGTDYFMKYWAPGQLHGNKKEIFELYKIEKLSFGYFISNLIEDVYLQKPHNSLPESLKNVMYPIAETKEAHVEYPIPLD